MSTTEENKAIVRRHFKEVLEGGNVGLIESYFTPDGSTPESGTPEGWRELFLWHHQHCPGFKVTILDLMAEGDKVMAHLQFDLTYRVMPDSTEDVYPPLGKAVQWCNMNVFRLVDGKIVSQRPVRGWTDMLPDSGFARLVKAE